MDGRADELHTATYRVRMRHPRKHYRKQMSDLSLMSGLQKPALYQRLMEISPMTCRDTCSSRATSAKILTSSSQATLTKSPVFPSYSQYAPKLQIRDPFSPTQAKQTSTMPSAQCSQPSPLQPSQQSKNSTPRKTTHPYSAASR